MQKWLYQAKNEQKKTGFVPTMGALHEGHISLIEQSRHETDITACSIFVNPTQFNDPGDFEKYPVALEKDIYLLEKHHTDILFLPSVHEIYPSGSHSSIHYNLGYLENILEGFYRPGHFQGVCQVVDRLLAIMKPHTMWLGQKDYQQYMVIKKMAEDYHPDVTIKTGNTLREANGLAMSSRNMRLTRDAREKAGAIYRALLFIKKNIHVVEIPELKMRASDMIMHSGFAKIDYIEICNSSTLHPVTHVDNDTTLIALAAAFIEGVRLIDNMQLV